MAIAVLFRVIRIHFHSVEIGLKIMKQEVVGLHMTLALRMKLPLHQR